jgi:hypothetical protein
MRVPAGGHPAVRLSPWLLLSLAAAAFGVVGVLRAPSTDAATVDDIAGFGYRMDGKQCYLTLTYTVRGASYRFQSSDEQRWCDYQPLYRQHGSVIVYYDSSNPNGDTHATRTNPSARRSHRPGLSLSFGCPRWSCGEATVHLQPSELPGSPISEAVAAAASSAAVADPPPPAPHLTIDRDQREGLVRTATGSLGMGRPGSVVVQSRTTTTRT